MIIIFYSRFFIMLAILAAFLVVLAYDLLIFPKRIKRLKELEARVFLEVEGLR